MGLDSVELIVKVEKTFDIVIPDSEAVNIGTVGDFYEVVWNKIKDKKSNKCSSAMLFYRLRQFLLSKHEFCSNDFKSDANINDLIPRDIRKIKWKEIQQDFEYKLPDLELPFLVREIQFYAGLTIIVGPLIFAIISVFFFNASKLSFLFPIASILVMISINYLLRPFKTDIEQKSIKEFIQTVLAMNYEKIRLINGTNRTEMEKVMNCFIHDITGADYSEIRPEASLTNDLGIN